MKKPQLTVLFRTDSGELFSITLGSLQAYPKEGRCYLFPHLKGREFRVSTVLEMVGAKGGNDELLTILKNEAKTDAEAARLATSIINLDPTEGKIILTGTSAESDSRYVLVRLVEIKKSSFSKPLLAVDSAEGPEDEVSASDGGPEGETVA